MRRTISSLVLRSTALLVFSAVFTSLLPAQDKSFYLDKRKEAGVDRPMPDERWTALPEGKIAELRGEIAGAVSAGEGHMVTIRRPDGTETAVEASSLPTWFETGIMVRVLIRVGSVMGQPSYYMQAIARDEWITAYDPPVPSSKTAQKNSPTRPVVVARGGLSGPIGRRAISAPPRRAAKTLKSRRSAPRVVTSSTILRTYAAFIKRQNRRLSDAEATRIAQSVIGFSVQHGVDARLIVAMCMVESQFRPEAVSRSGARGLGQLMPGTARMLGVRNSHDSVDNLSGMVRLVRRLLDTYVPKHGEARGLQLAMAAYNAGPGAVARHGGVPPYRETQNYVIKVIGIYRQLQG